LIGKCELSGLSTVSVTLLLTTQVTRA